jgi:hypothetical protein
MMEDNLFILTMRCEQACTSHCKAAEVEDLIEEVAEAEAFYQDEGRKAAPHTRAWRRAYICREHLGQTQGSAEGSFAGVKAGRVRAGGAPGISRSCCEA